METRSLVSYRLYEPLEAQAEQTSARPRAHGKFIHLGQHKFYLRGVTYGPFAPDKAGSEYHDVAQVEADFSRMASSGLNSVRTYTVPPIWLLDAALQHGLRVLIGLPWEQHIAFLDDKRQAKDIEMRIRAGVRLCANHPAVLGYTIGNEIPASIVRWYGPRRVQKFIERLYCEAKTLDPDALVTYVNYPTTEYLSLEFLDAICFNVFLQSQERLAAYLKRLQNLAGERPLILGEVGLDSRRHGIDKQASALGWQIRTAFESGCAGAFVFSWTDEWQRGGYEIQDWQFGITTRTREPKPALAAVRSAFAQVPFSWGHQSPRVSVVVCSHNGARTLRDCCEGLTELDYPDYEVIVVDDGSKDATASIAREYGFQVITTENQGLSHARNVGMEAANGEIVAYIDDDTQPDSHWLTYLTATFRNTSHSAVGGPNIPHPGDGPFAECVANAPGNPTHVLVSDEEAEHLPGCNLAVRRDRLRAVGGFDPQFRVAGDDVDLCWRLQQRGWTLGFNPGAVVWHHRRKSLTAYWRQQRGYGKAEALLENKWPEKYNAAGHSTWSGRVYGKGIRKALDWRGERIHHGSWGSALFQSVYHSAPEGFWWMPLLPEWYLVILGLAGLTALGFAWTPMFLFLPFLALASGLLIAQAWLAAANASFPIARRSTRARFALRGLTFILHLVQPLARLVGRRWDAISLFRRNLPDTAWPRRHTFAVWCEQWQPPEERLQALEACLRKDRAYVFRGGDFDRWDLGVRGGILGSVRGLLAVEEHGAGRQYVRLRTWPKVSVLGLALPLALFALATWGIVQHAWAVGAILGGAATLLSFRVFLECGAAMGAVRRALEQMTEIWRAS